MVQESGPMPTLALFLFRFARLLFSGHAAVAAENAALRLQLAAFQRQRRRPYRDHRRDIVVHITPARRMTASAFILVSRATSKGSPCWNFGRKSSTERGPAYSLSASFLRIRVSGLTPSPGMTRVELSKSSRGISGTS